MCARSPRYVRLVRLSPPALAPPHATAAMQRFKLVTFLAGTSKPAPGLEWATAGHGPPGKPTYPRAGIRAALPPPAHMSTCRPCQCAWLCSQMANPGVFHMPGYPHLGYAASCLSWPRIPPLYQNEHPNLVPGGGQMHPELGLGVRFDIEEVCAVSLDKKRWE